jgi:hypothetical protein
MTRCRVGARGPTRGGVDGSPGGSEGVGELLGCRRRAVSGQRRGGLLVCRGLTNGVVLLLHLLRTPTCTTTTCAPAPRHHRDLRARARPHAAGGQRGGLPRRPGGAQRRGGQQDDGAGPEPGPDALQVGAADVLPGSSSSSSSSQKASGAQVRGTARRPGARVLAATTQHAPPKPPTQTHTPPGPTSASASRRAARAC